MNVPALSALNVEKRYGGVQALAGVSLEVYPGEVHALVGVNGAGKSTLMKILSGAETPDAGNLAAAGRSVRFASVRDASAEGISIVFQELSLYGDLDVLSNLYLLREPRRFGLVRRREMANGARHTLASLGLSVDVNSRVRDLQLSEQQLIEIAKAVLEESSVLILDEPNSALNAVESERLFSLVRQLRDQGVAILYVSHRLEEVFAISDRITVLRDGKVALEAKVKDASIPEIVSSMLGEESATRLSTPRSGSTVQGPPALLIEGVPIPGENGGELDLEVRRGEIVGLAGLEGAGHRVLLEILAGLRKAKAGKITLPDGGSAARTPYEAVQRGVAHVPADRRVSGVALSQTNLENLHQVKAGVLKRHGFWLWMKKLKKEASERMIELGIGGTPETRTGLLSGGNQQKVVMGKWLAAEPNLMLCDDPTRGVDVGAKAEIYGLLRSIGDRGCATLFHSSEVEEYLEVCDRVLVFGAGEVVAEFRSDELSVHRLLEAMNTGKKNESEG